MYCPPRWQDVLPTQMRISHNTERQLAVPTKNGHILIQLPVRGYLDGLYTLFNYRFNDKIVAKSGHVFGNNQRAVYFIQRNRGRDKMPGISKKGSWEKKYRKHLLSSFQKTKSAQTRGSVFAKRSKQVKKVNFSLELRKNCRLFSRRLW